MKFVFCTRFHVVLGRLSSLAARWLCFPYARLILYVQMNEQAGKFLLDDSVVTIAPESKFGRKFCLELTTKVIVDEADANPYTDEKSTDTETHWIGTA